VSGLGVGQDELSSLIRYVFDSCVHQTGSWRWCLINRGIGGTKE